MPTDSNLVLCTRELLRHRSRTRTIEVIARETGLTVRFIETFRTGSNKDYGVNRVTKLYEYLSGKKLEVA